MGWLYRFLSGSRKEDHFALMGFLQNAYWAEPLSEEESMRNIEESVVEILKDDCHAGNGLLLTEHGYLITPSHCLQHTAPVMIRTHDSQRYIIEQGITRNESEGISLAKASIPAPSRPKRYKLFQQPRNQPASLLVRKYGSFISRHGYIMSSHSRKMDIGRVRASIVDQIVTNIPSYWGDSGGPIVTADGRLAGICGGDLYSTLEMLLKHTEKL